MLFAIRISKDWIELRSSPRTIKGVKSTITKHLPSTGSRMVRDGWIIPPADDGSHTGFPKWRKEEIATTKKLTLSQVNWLGGRSLGTFNVVAFNRICKIPSSVGGAIKLPKLPITSTRAFVAKLRKREHKAFAQGDIGGDDW